MSCLSANVCERHSMASSAVQAEFCTQSEQLVSPFTFTAQRFRLNKENELFEDGDVHRHLYLQDVATCVEQDCSTATVSEFMCHIAGCSQLFDTLESYEHHYNACHRHVCFSCRRFFPANHLLDIHILEWHDSLFQIMAEKQNMYQCLVEGCHLKFKTSKERRDHLIKTHRYPPDFRFDKSKKPKRALGKTMQRGHISMEVSEDASPVDKEDTMEICPNHAPQCVAEPKPRYSCRVPTNICFGQGSVRGFRGRRRK